jgi:HEAT repeat protein
MTARGCGRALLAAAILVACGPAADEPTPPVAGHPAAPTASVAARSAPVADDAQVAAQAARLVAEWTSATDDAERERLAAALVALGRPAVDAVLAALPRDPWEPRFEASVCLVRNFGVLGCTAVAEALPRLPAEVRGPLVAQVLTGRTESWGTVAESEAICRALVAAAATEDDAERRSDLWDALATAYPASRVAVPALAARLGTATGREREALVEALVECGTDAAPAAPLVVEGLASDDEDLRYDASRILVAVGPADPSILSRLLVLLAEGSDGTRAATAEVLGTWGDTAAAAVPTLVRLLNSDDLGVRVAAVRALASISSAAKDVWPHLLAVADGDADAGWEAWEAVQRLLADPAVRADCAARLAAQPAGAQVAGLGAIAEVDEALARRLARELASGLLDADDPHVRAAAAEALHAIKAEDLARLVTPLLQDADPYVRGRVLGVLAAAQALPEARVREFAAAMLVAPDAGSRQQALVVFARVPAAASDLPALVAALDDPDTFDAAVTALARTEGPLPVRDPTLARRLAGAAIRCGPGCDDLAALLGRVEGGDAVLVEMLRDVFRSDESAAWDEAVWVAHALGPRGAAAAPDLRAAAARAVAAGRGAERIEQAARALEGDLEALVSFRSMSVAMARRLLGAGESERRTLLLHMPAWIDPDIAPVVRRDPAFAATVRGASSTPDTEPGAQALREAAAKAAWALPPDEALSVLVRLASDPSDDVRAAAAEGLEYVARRLDKTPSPPQLAALLGNDHAAVRRAAAVLALSESAPDHGLDAALRVGMTRDAPSDWRRRGPETRMAAAVALWCRTGDAAAALPVVRAALRTGWVSFGSEWDVVGDALVAMPLGRDDLDALLEALRHETRGGLAVPALLRALTRFGSGASPAVPYVRVALRSTCGTTNCFDPTPRAGAAELQLAEAAARLLVAIGPAAREALPDLRRAAAFTGDPHHVVRDAIVAIESAPR